MKIIMVLQIIASYNMFKIMYAYETGSFCWKKLVYFEIHCYKFILQSMRPR